MNNKYMEDIMDQNTNTTARLGRLSVVVGRVLFTLALLSLIGAWIAQSTGGKIFGMDQQHLFNDTFALSLLGVGAFLDAFWHSKGKV